jgi:hypothetical protein
VGQYVVATLRGLECAFQTGGFVALGLFNNVISIAKLKWSDEHE